jgi:hypothetical protein
MVGSTYFSVPPLGNAPFPLQVRHLCAELRLPGQAIAGRHKVLTRNAHATWTKRHLARWVRTAQFRVFILILYEDEVIARIAPDAQQDPFVLGALD